MRAATLKSAGVPAVLGGTLGVIGTFLCLWSVAAYYAPSAISPVPQLSMLSGQVSQPLAMPTTLAGPPTAPASRIVAPIDGADVTAPAVQLRANVLHIAFGLCVGVGSAAQMHDQYGDALGGVPLYLNVGPDGTVTSGSSTFSRLPADMVLEYTATQAGAYSLTVRDRASGLGIGCDSTSNKILDR